MAQRPTVASLAETVADLTGLVTGIATAVEALSAAVVETRPAADTEEKQEKKVAPKDPNAPVSYRQRKYIAVLTGTFPEGAMTMGEASAVIDANK